jgi:hypothetical protein
LEQKERTYEEPAGSVDGRPPGPDAAASWEGRDQDDPGYAMTSIRIYRRVSLWIDQAGSPSVCSVDWVDPEGKTLETLVIHAGPFDTAQEMIEILVAQKMKSRVDEILTLFED